MKRSILINSFGNDKWIGGVYYRRNIAYQLSQNDYIHDNYRIVIFTTNSQKNIFKDIKGIKIVSTSIKSAKFLKIFKGLISILFRVSIEFPIYREVTKLGVVPVSWIPDFQHKYYPEFFSSNEIEYRDSIYKKYRESNYPLVLSSFNAFEDFIKFYNSKTNVYVVPFVSFIEPEIKKLTDEYSNGILHKFNLQKNKYMVLMNQFWQHKNHLVVFQAFEILLDYHPECDFICVLTGNFEDYRNPNYIEVLKSYINKPSIRQHIILLGFISRDEQLAIMKNSSFVIQPSLFEGWGTVVEDAKVLDKTVLLSDIPVHREQMNNKCILFDPHNSSELADLIYQELNSTHYDNVDSGLSDMSLRAKMYSVNFEKLIRDLEKSK